MFFKFFQYVWFVGSSHSYRHLSFQYNLIFFVFFLTRSFKAGDMLRFERTRSHGRVIDNVYLWMSGSGASVTTLIAWQSSWPDSRQSCLGFRVLRERLTRTAVPGTVACLQEMLSHHHRISHGPSHQWQWLFPPTLVLSDQCVWVIDSPRKKNARSKLDRNERFTDSVHNCSDVLVLKYSPLFFLLLLNKCNFFTTYPHC